MSEQRIDHAGDAAATEDADVGEGQGLATEGPRPATLEGEPDETARSHDDRDRKDPYVAGEGDTEGERLTTRAVENE